jgi:hypothetical protein
MAANNRGIAALRVVDIESSYEHTWWQDATFSKPAAASLFSYIFRRQDDVVKVDFTVALNPPPLVSQRGKIRRRCRRIDIAKPVAQMERATGRVRCRLMALFGHGAMSDLSPECGPKQTFADAF